MSIFVDHWDTLIYFSGLLTYLLIIPKMVYEDSFITSEGYGKRYAKTYSAGATLIISLFCVVWPVSFFIIMFAFPTQFRKFFERIWEKFCKVFNFFAYHFCNIFVSKRIREKLDAEFRGPE